MIGIGWFELLIIGGILGLSLLAVVIVVVVALTTSKRRSIPVSPNLFPCPDCGRHVSRLAASCPNCGRPLTSQGQN